MWSRISSGLALVTSVAGLWLALRADQRTTKLETELAAMAPARPIAPANPHALEARAGVNASSPTTAGNVPSDTLAVPVGVNGAANPLELQKAANALLAKALAPPAPPPTSLGIPIDVFLRQNGIGEAVWKNVEKINTQASQALYKLGQTGSKMSVEDAEKALDIVDQARRKELDTLLNPEQLRSYERMRESEVAGMISISGGAIKRWISKY